MIPIEVEYRIASYFFHRYLPEEVMVEVEERLLTAFFMDEKQRPNLEELVLWAIGFIDYQLENKSLK